MRRFCWYFYYWKGAFCVEVRSFYWSKRMLIPMSYISLWEWQKVVPQGPFGWIKLYFEPEKRPAGAFRADQIVFWARKAFMSCLLFEGYNYSPSGLLLFSLFNRSTHSARSKLFADLWGCDLRAFCFVSLRV